MARPNEGWLDEGFLWVNSIHGLASRSSNCCSRHLLAYWGLAELEHCLDGVFEVMDRKQITMMGLPSSASSMFASRSLFSAKDVLCKTELDLMEILDVSLPELSPALDHIQASACPPHHSILSLWEERKEKEIGGGYLATKLKELDEALHGGIPFGLITELVGAAGVGKTQFCLMLSVLAAMPNMAGGCDHSVIYIDTEHKFSSGRLMEIAQNQFPELAGQTKVMQQLAKHILVVHPTSIFDLMKSLQGLEIMVIEHSVCLVIIDSVAALLQSDSEGEILAQRQEMLGKQASLLKFLAESFRIPVVVTNQVRLESTDPGSEPDITVSHKHEDPSEEAMEEGFTAALGTRWAHSVNIRLLLEFSTSGWRHIKIVKSPMSAFASVPYSVTSKGLELQVEQVQDFNAST